MRQTEPDAAKDSNSWPMILKIMQETAAIMTNKYPDQAHALLCIK